MIPKIIHYCWFGRGEKSKLMKKCIKSWKKFCPDYEIIEWNEDNFDVNSCLWTKQAYECKKWAFVSDYIRLKVLYERGGIYMDTDVEIVQSLDCFLKHDAFLGFEKEFEIATSTIGATKQNILIKKFLSYYDKPFVNNENLNTIPNTIICSELLSKEGVLFNNSYQEINGATIYPKTYFSPLRASTIENCTSENTYTIHHYEGSWLSKEKKKEYAKMKRQQKRYQFFAFFRYLPNRMIRKIFGNEKVDNWKNKRGKQ